MCIARNRFGRECLSDFVMGDGVLSSEELGLFDSIKGLLSVDPTELKPFEDERKRQFEANPPRGLKPTLAQGWHCPNCGGAHAPDMHSCPEPPRGGSLRERLKSAS